MSVIALINAHMIAFMELFLLQITGNLVKSKLKVPEQYVHVLPMNTEVTVEGIKVILLEANQ